MDELIRKQDALDAFNGEITIQAARNAGRVYTYLKMVTDRIKALPPVQPTIVRCKDCEHWNLQVGNVKGDGLGSCDFHNVNLVTGEGFCYWAEKRGEDNG